MGDIHEFGNIVAAYPGGIEEIKVELDQCWDVLRQREARHEFAQDPSKVTVRPASVVERFEP
jgi:hypothetical protein